MRIVGYMLVALLLVSCEYFTPREQDAVLASIGDQSLTEEQLNERMPEGLAGQDSLVWRQNTIDRWLIDQQLMLRAQENLTALALSEMDQLVEDYKLQLFRQNYIENIVAQQLDTLVSDEEINRFYRARGKELPLNEYLVKYRYVQSNVTGNDQYKLATQLNRYNESDKAALDSTRGMHTAMMLRDSVWTRGLDMFRQIPMLNNTNARTYLKPGRKLRFTDSTGVYLGYVRDVLAPGEQPPLEYIAPVMKQIILNQRKQAFIKRFEKDLLQLAYKNDYVQDNK